MNPNRARSMVHAAIRKGVLTRPETCEKCGRRPDRGVGGRSNIQGHHPDYSKPLDVEWLCLECHREAHGSNLNDKAVAHILTCGLTNAELGKMYGVDSTTVGRVRNGHMWTSIAPKDIGDQGSNIAELMERRRLAHPIGQRCPRSKLTESQVREMRIERINTGLSYRKLAAKYGLKSHKSAREVCNGSHWSHIESPKPPTEGV